METSSVDVDAPTAAIMRKTSSLGLGLKALGCSMGGLGVRFGTVSSGQVEGRGPGASSDAGFKAQKTTNAVLSGLLGLHSASFSRMLETTGPTLYGINVAPPLLQRPSTMCSCPSLLRIRGNDWRPAMMCFDFGVSEETRPSLPNQSIGNSEL